MHWALFGIDIPDTDIVTNWFYGRHSNKNNAKGQYKHRSVLGDEKPMPPMPYPSHPTIAMHNEESL